MSSNITVERICIFCNKVFTAKTTTTKYCSHKCNQRHYKAKERKKKIELSNKVTTKKKTVSIEIINAKEFLTVKEVATLLNCSIRTVYYQIQSGQIKATNLGQRMTRIKRAEIDKLFEQKQTFTKKEAPTEFNLSDYYTIDEVIAKYNINSKLLYNLGIRENLNKVQKGKFVFYLKTEIHQHLGE
jgi:excisionase family DNA binding protein